LPQKAPALKSQDAHQGVVVRLQKKPVGSGEAALYAVHYEHLQAVSDSGVEGCPLVLDPRAEDGVGKDSGVVALGVGIDCIEGGEKVLGRASVEDGEGLVEGVGDFGVLRAGEGAVEHVDVVGAEGEALFEPAQEALQLQHERPVHWVRYLLYVFKCNAINLTVFIE
jgi:hypothetical protein